MEDNRVTHEELKGIIDTLADVNQRLVKLYNKVPEDGVLMRHMSYVAAARRYLIDLAEDVG